MRKAIAFFIVCAMLIPLGVSASAADIDSAATGVMFFCAAGKDRTGVVSALLQRRAGMPREAIVADYALSGTNLREFLAAFGRQRPEIDPAVYTPQPAYMEAFLDMLDASPWE